jgi:CO dehydrogenase/acetyl-CoA synthase epsilon subunit
VGIRAYHHTTVGHLVAALLRTYKYPFNRFSEQTVYLRRGLVFELVRQKGTRLIFIDSAHHLLAYGNRRTYDPVGNDFLTELMDETKVGLVLAGGESLASNDHFSKDLASRVTALHEVKNFQATAQWEGLLRALIKTCKSVRLDIIVSPGQAKMLHGATGGNLRSLKRFLIEVVMVCVDDAKDTVDISHLSIAYMRIVGEASTALNPYVVQNEVASKPLTA